jgi:HEAT repeat protein
MGFEKSLASIANPDLRLNKATLMGLCDADAGQVRLFRAAWADIQVERRRAVVRALVKLAEEDVEADFAALLRACLKDPDAELRAAAIAGLLEDESGALADELIRLLATDPSPDVRAAAAMGLNPFAVRASAGEMRGHRPAAIHDALLSAFRRQGEDDAVRGASLASVGYWEEEQVREAIAATYADEDPRFRAWAVHAMGANLAPMWRPHILAELASPHRELRAAAAFAAGSFEMKEALPALAGIAAGKDADLAYMAVNALGTIGGPAAKKALAPLMEAGDVRVRVAAREAMLAVEFMDNPLGVPKGGADVDDLARRRASQEPL